MILEKSRLSYDSVKSIMTSVRRLSSINIENIFTYRSHSDINDMCTRLNSLKRKSNDAFTPFISNSTKTLCHSMGNPLKVAEDIIELEEENDLLNSLLKIVTFLSSKYAAAASIAALIGDCQYPETSFVFDEQNSSSSISSHSSYRKEIAHMARYYRLHLGSFLAIELAKELKGLPSMYKENRFESIIELYESGCADYIFNFVVDNINNTREEKLVTPVLMNLDGNKKVLAIHIYGDEKIRLWKRWGDGYDALYDINGNRSGIYMEVSPFFNSVAII
ncbi:MAG: hypothetical protein WAM14_23340 [Candidatus Nitrosopolaris sp.]